MMALPDDLKDTNSQVDNSDFWLITIPDLDPQTLTFDGKYNFIFRWQWEDGTYGKWSVAKEFQTDSLPNLEVYDLTSSWKVNTLTIKFKGPKVLVNDVQVQYADKFIIELTDIDSGRSHTFTQNLQSSDEQTFILDSKTAQEFYRPTSTNKTYQPTRFNGVIKVHSADGISTGLSFTTSTNSSGYGNKTIPDDAWGTVSVLDGYTISLDWDKLEAAGILKENFAYVNFYEAAAIGTEPNTTAGSFSFIKTGENGTLIYHPTSLLSHYVYITITDKSGNTTQNSSVKKVKALNPSGYDDEGPSNNGSLTLETPTVDDNGLFDFNYKFKINWTAESDATTSGYRIRWRVAGSSDPYTYTLVPGKNSTSTYLYGVVANTTYEVGKNTLDEYGNTTAAWKTSTVTTGAFNGEIKESKYLKAGNMKLGYGITGKGGAADVSPGSNKGLYLGPSNYWYITGNQVTDSGAYIKVGSETSNLIFDGIDLSVTGKIYALGGEFTGSVRVGSDTASGQLKVYVNSTTGIELGDFNQAIPSGIPGTVNSGIYAYAGNNYTLINAADGSIRTNSLYASGTVQTKPDNAIGLKGAVKMNGGSGAFELLDSSDRVRFGIHGSSVNGPAEIIIAADDIGYMNGYPAGSPYIAMVNLKTSLGDSTNSQYININPGVIGGPSFSFNQYGAYVNDLPASSLGIATFKNIIISPSTPGYAEVGTIWIQLG